MLNETVRLKFDLAGALTVPANIQRAYLRAGTGTIRRTLSWARTRVIRTVALTTGIKQIALRKSKRVQLHVKYQGITGTIWVGIKDAAPSYFGKPRQLKGGAKVKSWYVPGTFVATMPRARAPEIWKHVDASKRIALVRFPLKGAEQAVVELQPEIVEHLQTAFTHELNYQLNVRGRGK